MATPRRMPGALLAGLRADPDWPRLLQAIRDRDTLLAMAYARQVRKRHRPVTASQVLTVAQTQVRDDS